jgi:uncharacterized GH25 family protein
VALPGFKETPGLWIVTGRYDNGYWIEAPDGHYFNTSRRDMPEGKNSAHYFKFSKALLASGFVARGFDRVVGHRLEIIPQSNPFSLKVGDTLLVQVRYEGSPLPAVGLENGDNSKAIPEDQIERHPTDSNGIARLPIRKNGFQFIAVDYAVPSAHPDLASNENYTATLTFVLP